MKYKNKECEMTVLRSDSIEELKQEVYKLSERYEILDMQYAVQKNNFGAEYSALVFYSAKSKKKDA